MNRFRMAMLLVCLFVGLEREASAYTDPGTGALIWQMVAAAFVGGMFYFRRFRDAVSRLWTRNKREER